MGALILHASRGTRLVTEQHPWLPEQLEGDELVRCQFLHTINRVPVSATTCIDMCPHVPLLPNTTLPWVSWQPWH
jgi:hypothetical protein